MHVLISSMSNVIVIHEMLASLPFQVNLLGFPQRQLMHVAVLDQKQNRSSTPPIEYNTEKREFPLIPANKITTMIS